MRIRSSKAQSICQQAIPSGQTVVLSVLTRWYWPLLPYTTQSRVCLFLGMAERLLALADVASGAAHGIGAAQRMREAYLQYRRMNEDLADQEMMRYVREARDTPLGSGRPGYQPRTIAEQAAYHRSRPEYKRAREAETRRLVRDSGEKKGVDTDFGGITVVSSTSTNDDMFVANLIPPGASFFQRVGRKIYSKSLRIQGVFRHVYAEDVGTLTLGNVLRMVVVWDKQPSGVLPTFDEIFGGTAQNGASLTGAWLSLRLESQARFVILREKTWNCQILATQSGNSIANSTHVDEFIKLNNRETTFSGTSDPCTIADVDHGGLYVIWRADSDLTTNRVQWSDGEMRCRLRYTD